MVSLYKAGRSLELQLFLRLVMLREEAVQPFIDFLVLLRWLAIILLLFPSPHLRLELEFLLI